MAEHDYIVVGSGAGGGPLAARLAERGHRVLLLDAGGDDAPWTYQAPVFHGLATEDPQMRLDHYVRHYGDEGRQALDPKYERERGGVFYPRARTLGGCTAHYAMIIIRPHDSDWEAIREATGDDSWAPERMNDYFARVEHCDYRDGGEGGHGTDGWLPTRLADVIDLAAEAIKHHDLLIGEIAAKAIVAPLPPRPPIGLSLHNLFDPVAKFDPNDTRVLRRHSTGTIAVPMAIDQRGRRAGARERVLGVRDRLRAAGQGPGRLDVRLHTHVTGLVYDPRDAKRVIGVRYLPGERLYRADRDAARFGTPTGPEQELHANREVILSAGAYITPQLLMLSGIGPKAALKQHGIDCVVDLPGVGENLQDRYEVGIVSQTEHPFGLLRDATFAPPAEGEPGDPLFQEWRDRGKGLYATNGAVIGFTVRSSAAEHGEPDLFVFGVPGSFVGYYTGWSKDAVQKPYDKWTWLLLKAHARFRGRVTLRSKNALDPPLVNFDYFPRDADGAPTPDSARDLQAMREGVELVREMISDSGLLRLHPEAMKGVDLGSGAGIDKFVQDRAWGHHASCTCKIGGDDDPDAVLDSKFRVRGVKGLRVVDASVFPQIPGFFVVMPTYMISEKAADAIHADAGS